MATRIRHLLADNSGQDLIEYALLTAFFGLAAMAALTITGGLGASYSTMTSNTNDLWVTPDPAPPATP